jgi:2-octaprenyl-6-methoxyphenol hydroxylase
LLLQQHAHHHVVISEARTEPNYQDTRTLALSWGSLHTLQQLGIPILSHIAPITTIHISQQHHAGHTTLNHAAFNVPVLGGVIGYGQLLSLLLDRLNQVGIHIDYGQQIPPDQLVHTAERYDYVVQAEGGWYQAPQTNTNTQHNRPLSQQQVALLLMVEVSQPRAGWAFERFTPQGPLAFLPLSSAGNVFHVVWCMSPQHSQHLLATPEHLQTRLQHEFGERLGTITLKHPLNAIQPIPLGQRVRETQGEGNIVWIGNSAQILHPVAGQGLNLGLRDAVQWVKSLSNSTSPPTSLLAVQHVQRYCQQRRIDRGLMQQITSHLAHDFIPQAYGASLFRGTALAGLHLLTPLKHAFGRHMMLGWRP